MSTQATLKLVHDCSGDVLPFERRDDTRRKIHGQVTATQSCADAVVGSRNRICSLQLVDISRGGLGAVSSEPIDVDTEIAIFFAPHGPEQPINYRGRVVRSSPRGAGAEIGVSFGPKSAA
jgi:hypothetical protein